MPTNHREDEEVAANELDLEIEPIFDEDGVDFSDERVVEFDEDVEDIDLDSLTALEGPDWF